MSSPIPFGPPTIIKSVTRSDCNRLCLKYGPFVQLVGVSDPWGNRMSGSQLLLSLAGRESSFGHNIAPRHEPAYDIGGALWKNSQELRELVARYGPLGASSFGLIQVMAINARGFSPPQLAASVEDAMRASVDRLNYRILGQQGASNLKEICECWNGGHIGAKTTAGYYDEVCKHYAGEVMAWAEEQ